MKEIEIDKEALETLLMLHVADRVDMDQRPDTSDNQRHVHAQRVDQQRSRDIEGPDRDPIPEVNGDSACSRRQGE